MECPPPPHELKEIFGTSKGYGKVWKLRRALHGFKQASKVWNGALEKVLHSIGFEQSDADPCM